MLNWCVRCFSLNLPLSIHTRPFGRRQQDPRVSPPRAPARFTIEGATSIIKCELAYRTTHASPRGHYIFAAPSSQHAVVTRTTRRPRPLRPRTAAPQRHVNPAALTVQYTYRGESCIVGSFACIAGVLFGVDISSMSGVLSVRGPLALRISPP